MRKILNNCPKKQRSNCKGCNSCNRCRLIRLKEFWQTWCIAICMLVMVVILCFQLTLLALVKYDNYKQKIRDEEREKRIEEYTVPEWVTKKNVKETLAKIEPMVIVDAEPTVMTGSIVETKNVQLPEQELEQPEATISAYGPGDTYFYWISDNDYLNMKKVVYKEARGESFEGMVAVAAIVLNRWTSGDYSKFDCSSVTSVILQEGQFAPISDVTEADLTAYPEITEAVQQALKGYDPTRKMFADGAKFFFQAETTYGVELDRRQGIEYLQIGNHRFHNDFAY